MLNKQLLAQFFCLNFLACGADTEEVERTPCHTFPVQVDYSLTLREMVEMGDYANIGCPGRYPDFWEVVDTLQIDENGLGEEVCLELTRVELITPSGDVPTWAAIQEIEKQNLRLAKPEELLTLGIEWTNHPDHYLDINEIYRVVALGEPWWYDHYGYPWCFEFSERSDGIRLDIGPCYTDWPVRSEWSGGTLFLTVRE